MYVNLYSFSLFSYFQAPALREKAERALMHVLGLRHGETLLQATCKAVDVDTARILPEYAKVCAYLVLLTKASKDWEEGKLVCTRCTNISFISFLIFLNIFQRTLMKHTTVFSEDEDEDLVD